MAINKQTTINVVPMPSRIEITFNSFIPGTKIPNVDDQKIKFYYQDYEVANSTVHGSNIMEFNSKELKNEDFEKCMKIFVKTFEEQYSKINMWGFYVKRNI